MKLRGLHIQFIFFLLFISIGFWFDSGLALAKSSADQGWYAFSLSPELAADSCADLGKLILDAPAGKYGFLRVKDANFCFSNNAKARFWGINLFESACFPEKKQAEAISADLAFFGFNAVRLCGLDCDFAPNGIFEDIGAEHQDKQLKTTRYLDAGQLDKLDYLIYQLESKGIYICLNILSERQFTEADGIVDAELLDKAANPAAVFDDDLIELQKEYAQKLLTHTNKYTNLAYNQDPGICLIEVSDKNSLIKAWKNNTLNGNLFGEKNKSLSGYYTKQLDYSWNEYLRGKYGAVEIMRKAWQEPIDPAPVEPLNKVNWELESGKQTTAVVRIKGTTRTIRIRNISNKPDDLAYRANYLNLFKNKKYLLSFTISADKNMSIDIVSEQVFSPWHNLGLNQQLDISPVPQIITIPFSPQINCDNAKVSFIIGQSKGVINISDLVLKQIDSLPIIANEAALTDFKFHRPLYSLIKLYPSQEQEDIADFYTRKSAGYFKAMADFLKTECAVKAMITGIAAYQEPEDISVQSDCDYIATAAYWDYPRFNSSDQDKTDFTIKDSSVLQEQDLGILGKIQSCNPNLPDKKNKPFIVSAWTHCFPNKFSYESPTLLGSVGGINHWDGLFQFAYSIDKNSYDRTNPVIDDFFEIIDNPQQLLLSSVAGLAFKYEFESSRIKGLCGFTANKTLQAGAINVKSADDGAIFLCALDQKPAEQSNHFLLTCLSNVKNTNSGWEKEHFNWGSAPVLLKHVNLDIQIPLSKEAQVYVLDNSGKRSCKIKLNKIKDMNQFNPQEFDSPWFEILLKD